MNLANLTRYENFPRFADDGRVFENYMPTYEGRMVKFEDVVELLKHTDNSAMVPCECIHGIAINKDCSVCKEFMGVGRRVVAQHQ